MRNTILGAAGATLIAAAAFAQDYPTGPVTVVVPFSAGGPTDTVTRLVAEPMSKTLGQQVIVQNVGGAGGTLGATQVGRRHGRRLHAAAAPHRHVDGAVALPGPRLRPADRLRADRPRHPRADDDHRPQGLRAEHARRS